MDRRRHIVSARRDHLLFVSVSQQVSTHAQRADSVVYNVSDWLSDKPRDVSLLYASDRKLFNVTSASGVVRLHRDRASNRSVHSLALLADYAPPRRSVVLLVCLKMAAEDGTQPLPTSGYRAITAHVSENVAVGTTVVDDLGVELARRYDITSGNDARLFAIDHVTGSISTQAQVDYERGSLHRLVVRIDSDAAVSVAFAVVTISVDDVNEYRPLFPVPVYRRSVFGLPAAGMLVATVRALDRDSGRYGRVRYTPAQLPAPTSSSSFVVDPTSGHVWLSMTSRWSGDVTRLEMGVVAEDEAGWADHVIVQLMIRRRAKPSCAAQIFKFEVAASASVGHVIGRLSLTGNASSVTFSVRHQSEYFDVDRHTGDVVVRRHLSTLSSDEPLQVQRPYLYTLCIYLYTLSTDEPLQVQRPYLYTLCIYLYTLSTCTHSLPTTSYRYRDPTYTLYLPVDIVRR